MVLNTGYRMVYPFLPALARGLGVDLQAMALAVTARSTLGILTPVMGSLADTRGRKRAMLTGLGLSALGLALVPFWPTYTIVFAALLIAMAGKLIFDPAMQAYVGDRVAYARRGLAIAVTELGWSGAGLIGVPLVGWLMALQGWSAPFPWLAILALACMAVVWRLVPGDRPGALDLSRLEGFRSMLRHSPAMAGLSVGLLSTAGNEAVNIIFGAWMETSFGLNLAALGAASAVIGISELSGEGLVAGLSDRVGKRRLVGLALALNAAASLGLLLVQNSLVGALVGLFFFYITFEVVIVGSIPLMTEVFPAARATVMASNVAVLSLGRALGAAVGPMLFALGLFANIGLAALFDLLAVISLFAFVHVDG